MIGQTYDVIVLGAGAAGMMAAIEAGKRRSHVLLLEHSDKVGRKILISGGGRCNFTNTHLTPAAFVSHNEHFCKSALARFAPADFIRMVETHGIAYHEKKLGQLFCDHTARSIVELLVSECRQAGVVLQLATKIVSLQKIGGFFEVKTEQGDFQSSAVVVATGGLSIPKVGATGFGYRIAKQFGLRVVPTAPALDGFVLDKNLQKELHGLAGVSLDVCVTCRGISFRENILFTHHGLSGPAALQASLYWQPGESLTIDLLPDHDMKSWLSEKKRAGSRIEMKNLLGGFFPKRFAEYFTGKYFSHQKVPLAQVPDKALEIFADHLKGWQIIPAQTVGYDKAEVTRGGVDTAELSSKTMESKKVPGLYFVGEVVDVTGWLGGYNFQWAWSSGWVAGQYV